MIYACFYYLFAHLPVFMGIIQPGGPFKVAAPARKNFAIFYRPRPEAKPGKLPHQLKKLI
jgi:hypothetical protein